jgi:hypothetical protein
MEKTSKNRSIIWKATVKASPLIGNWFIWKIGNGEDVLIGRYPWIECKGKHLLLEQVIHEINNARFSHLHHIARKIFIKNDTKWLDRKEVGLSKDHAQIWK